MSSRLCLLGLIALALAPVSLRAQGDDNPTYVTGVFNGNSTTGCSYDPYTANAQRIIPDLTVAGAVGKYPLQWARIMNSRKLVNAYLGAAGGWTHSYQWRLVFTGNNSTTPSKYTVSYPDGRIVEFSNPVGSIYYPPLGITDTFLGVPGTGNCYLMLSDGGKVRFNQSGVPSHGSYTLSTETPDQIVDPNTVVTTMSYDTSNRLTEVKEKGGRKLKISYGTSGPGAGYISEVDTLAADGHISQWVRYVYEGKAFSGYTWNVLTEADYIYAPTLEPQPKAFYSYQASNKSTSVTPLIKTCQDVRYPGPMKNIQYVFVTSSPLSWGQLYQEKNFNGTLVAQLTGGGGSARTETRGDGPARTFTYGALAGTTGGYKAYLLKSYTDFLGHSTSLEYDDSGFVNSVTDANGHTTTYERFTMHGAATKITHPATATENPGKTVQYFYTDNTGVFLDHSIDELQHTTTYAYNSGTMTVSEIDYPDGGVEKFTYNNFNQVLTHTMPSNNATGGASTDSEKFSYDSSNGNLLTYTPPATASDPTPSPHPTKFHHDINDHVDTITDPLGNVTTLYHNEIGQVTIEQHGGNAPGAIQYTYNADTTLASKSVQLDATNWAETDYAYDDYKRPILVTNPTAHQTHFYYDAAGGTAAGLNHTDANVTRVVLPSGKATTQILYDENLRKEQVTVGIGTTDAAQTVYTYDAGGNLSTMTDPNGGTWSYQYDPRDRLINVTDPVPADRNSNGHTVDYTYDAASNLKTEKPANDQTVTYDSYDEMNRLLQKSVGQLPTAGAVTYYTWTKSGKLDTFTDPNLNIYSYDYDRLNRLVTASYPGYTTETYLYDLAGNLYQFKNRAGATETFAYDSRNRETSSAWSSLSPLPKTLTYDYASRLLTCNTGSNPELNGTSIVFTYFDDGTLHTQAEWGTGSYGDGVHRTITYGYNVDGLRSSVTWPGLSPYTYDYTNRNQLASLTGNGSPIVTYGYDNNGNILTRSPDNGTSSVYTLDAANRTTHITYNFTGSTNTIASRAYGYDELGNLTYAQRRNGLTDGFTYDKNSQLTKFRRDGTLSNGVVTGGAVTNYAMDASGNWTTAGGTVYVPNVANQYTSVDGVNASYNNGDLVGYKQWSYAYDSMSRLTSASKNGGPSANFYYDGLGRQVARTETSGGVTTTTYSVWDGWNLFAEYSNGSQTNRWIYAGNDLIRRYGTTYGTVYYYPDVNGSMAYLADNGGGLVERYTYDAHGTPSFADASQVTLSASQYGVNDLFTGQRWYPDLSLYDLRNRFYKPEWGRFLQPDPIGFAGDPANLYRYCGNNPANWSDPFGLRHKHQDGSDGIVVTLGGLPYPDDPSQIPIDGNGSTPQIRLGPPAEPFSNPGGIDSLFGGNGPRGGGGPGGKPGGVPGGNGNGPGGINNYNMAIDSGAFSRFLPSAADAASMTSFANGLDTGVSIYVGVTVGFWEAPATAIETFYATKGVSEFESLVAAAQKVYPNKAGITELHHIVPKYLGGAAKGARVPLDAAYHQQITNAFRAAWKYGQGTPSAAELEEIMSSVYSRFPLPPGY